MLVQLLLKPAQTDKWYYSVLQMRNAVLGNIKSFSHTLVH